MASLISEKRPNIVLIMADDLGYEGLECYGGTSYRTPVLNKMASEGIAFSHAYALPLCTPTRLQLMTGKYNFRNWQAFGIMDPNERTFGHMMSENGYKTCISGKWQFYSYNPVDFEPEWRSKGQRPEQSGFDQYCLWHTEHIEDAGSRYADPRIQVNGRYMEDTEGMYGPDVFVDFINDFMEQNREQPFFVYYPMVLTHAPFQPTPDSEGWPENRHDRDEKYFKDMVEYADKMIGRVIAKVDELGLSDNTLILFYSDNGTPREITSMLGSREFAGGKGETTDAGTRVPLIARWPGTIPVGQVLGDLVDPSDFVPTLLDLAGVDQPEKESSEGGSFLPQLKGEPGNPRSSVFFHHDPLPGWGKERYSLQRWAQDAIWKLYDDGRFFNVEADDLEQQPIAVGEAGSQGEAVRLELRKVLDEMG
jgi:arylsulfatase A-like enzyme